MSEPKTAEVKVRKMLWCNNPWCGEGRYCKFCKDACTPAPASPPAETGEAVAWLPKDQAAKWAGGDHDSTVVELYRSSAEDRLALYTRPASDQSDTERMREALEFIAEGRDVGRHDGLPEDGPAHDADTMFAVAVAALAEKAADK